MKPFKIFLTWCLLAFIWLLFMIAMTVSYADPIRDYKEPLICKPQEVRGNVTYTSTNPKDWIVLSWKTAVISRDKILFRYKGELVEVPMEGYSCLPKPQKLSET